MQKFFLEILDTTFMQIINGRFVSWTPTITSSDLLYPVAHLIYVYLYIYAITLYTYIHTVMDNANNTAIPNVHGTMMFKDQPPPESSVVNASIFSQLSQSSSSDSGNPLPACRT